MKTIIEMPRSDVNADEASTPYQSDLFAKDRWPHKPYCSDDLSAGIYPRSLAHALKKKYIQANPPHLRIWSLYDLDYAGAAIAWENANLPPPSWAAVNKENGHAHLVYGLTAPVLVDSPDMRQKPLRYLCAIEHAFTEILRADKGFAGLITKNPAHPLWRVLRGPRAHFELGYLSEFVDLPRFIPKPGKNPETFGLGRNVTLFDGVRKWAYKQVRKYKAEGGLAAWNQWVTDTNNEALVRNGYFQSPLDGKEVWHIAKSVSKWTWQNFDIAASDARFSQLQAHRGKASGEARLRASEDKRAAAQLMVAKGMNQSAIASELGVTRETVNRWLKQV